MAKRTKCLIPKCKGKMFARGQCVAHYNASSRRIKKGETTWEELEELGLSLPDGRLSDIDEAIANAR